MAGDHIPPSPGVLCAYGDATTSLRDEAAQTLVRQFHQTSDEQLAEVFDRLAEQARGTLLEEGVAEQDVELVHSADVRYHGQGFEIPVTIDDADGGLAAIADAFDAEHERLFGFLLEGNDHELVTVRVTARGPRPNVASEHLTGGDDPAEAKVTDTQVWADGAMTDAAVYDRQRLGAGARVEGPAVITEMDSTTLVLADHVAEVHPSGSLLITPVDHDTTTSSTPQTQEA